MMKGYLFHRWMGVIPRILLIFGLLFISPLAFASTQNVLIIKSANNSFFNRTVEQLINQTHKQIKFQIETLSSIESNKSLLDSSTLIITLGLNAANFLNDKKLDKPVIHSYLAEFQYLNHEKQDNHYSILLDQPLQRYLSFIKYLIATQKIGIIKHKNNKISSEKLIELSTTFDLNLEQYLFESGDNPVNTVRDLLQINDVLLSLPNPEIYNRQTLKGILLTSYRQNKPMISYSPAHVKSGALAAIYSSPENIGNQIADLLNKLLEDKSFKPSSHYFASEYEITINYRVARSLGLKLTGKKEILKKLKLEQNK